jgi:hypothetical protein
MKTDEYAGLWLMFVNIIPKSGYSFNDLIDQENNSIETFNGAWANIIIKAPTIHEALEIAPRGLQELNFEIAFIDKIENFMSLVENKELKKEVVKEGTWLLNSDFVFKISDRIFPYK